MSSHQFTLTQLRNPSALNPLIPANLPAHSDHLQSPTAFHILLPATHKFPTTPPTFSSGPPPLPSLLSILHHCPLHPDLSRQPQSCRLPRRPAVPRASLQPGPRPRRPSLPRLFPEAPRLPASPHSHPPCSARLCAGALLHDSPGAAAQRGRGGPLAPHPRPITGPAADASPVRVSDTPAAASARVHGGRPRCAGPRALV